MSRILIHMIIEKYGEYDIFHYPEPELFFQHVETVRKGDCPNTGNKLWFQGIISEISTGENSIEYLKKGMSADQINNSYDLIIAPMANIFSEGYTKILESLTDKFLHIKIPVYVIACGVQAGSYDELNDLCSSLREPASNFIRAIYNTGGEFALRGYFTKEFFDRLGFRSAVVTGCPSLYQLGRNLKVTLPGLRKTESEFKPIINGNFNGLWDIMRRYPESEFFDQHFYYKILYNRTYVNQDNIGMKDIKKMLTEYGYDAVELLSQGRIKLFPDMADWGAYIRIKGFDLAFGNRIHGNIMPVLNGIPAIVYATDSRTREMAEFFNMPVMLPEQKGKMKIYEMYQKLDYSQFNCNFGKRYDQFEEFLVKNGIVTHINDQNSFMERKARCSLLTEEKNMEFATLFENKRKYWKMYVAVSNLKKKINWKLSKKN